MQDMPGNQKCSCENDSLTQRVDGDCTNKKVTPNRSVDEGKDKCQLKNHKKTIKTCRLSAGASTWVTLSKRPHTKPKASIEKTGRMLRVRR